MAIRDIIKLPDPLLKKTSQPVERVDDELRGVRIPYHVREPGEYVVRWEADDGNGLEEWTIDVPVDVFYITGEWPVNIGPTGTC